MQLLHAITKSWKKDTSAAKENIINLVIQNHHLIRKHHVHFPNRLSSNKKNTIFLYFKKKKQLH